MADVADGPQERALAVELRVSGMTCHGCEQAISLLLRQHPAVDQVEADAKTGIVRVRLTQQVEIAELKDRLRAAGFDVQ